MKVSVAMTTYNSSQYVKEQLESIFNQTYLPDEIIIFDDVSTDNTEMIVNEIIAKAPNSVRVEFLKNPENIGHVKNFEKCISRCKGDIIFLCDSDDIWEKEKIQTVVAIFVENKKIKLVFHDATIINGHGECIAESLNEKWDHRNDKTNELELMLMNVQRKGIPYGNSIAFNKDFFENIVPFPEGYGHDEWISLCAPLYGKVVCMPQKLIRYRRHNNNTSGQKKSLRKRIFSYNRESWFTHPQEIGVVYQTYLERYEKIIPLQIKEELENQIEFQSTLKDIVDRKRWGGIKLLKFYFDGKYQKYRGTRNTLILDELYLLLHLFG